MRGLLRTWSARNLVFVIPLALAAQAFGVSCTTQSQMGPAQSSALEQTARALAGNVQTGNTEAVRAQTIAAVASQFGGIANSIDAVDPAIQGARITVDALYLLNAADLTSAQDSQFFCGLPASALTVEITIPNLPPGQYALALLHATGVKNPQQISLVLSQQTPGAPWKLAGFFTRPMTMAGHDGVWFWRQARDYARKNQNWDSWFYYQSAQYLLDPVDFLSSPNLEKLQREAEKVRPEGLPGGDPLRLTSGGVNYDVTSLHTGDFSGQLDLVLTYNATPGLNPVQSREQVTTVMRALLQQHPELRAGFHGLWVYAATPGNRNPFALELPMDQIENSGAPGQHG
jgi:hypothetical protein